MKRNINIITFLLLILPSIGYAQREIYDMDGHWQFTPEWTSSGTLNVEVPHIWETDARGMAGYVKICDIPKTFEGKTAYIKFKGVSQRADVFVNSKYLGTHKSGYSAFAYNLTGLLTYGSRNTFGLRVSNSANLGQMPLTGDFDVYGGIFRDVELIVVPGTHICIDQYATDGVYVTPVVTDDGSAEIHVDAKLCLASGDKTVAKFLLVDADGNTIDSVRMDYRTGRTEEKDEEILFRLQSPHLWNGTEDPYMYSVRVRMESTTVSKKSTFDQVEVSFGIRTVEVNSNNKFLLNGQPYEIKGVVRYEDWPVYGNALGKIQQDKDLSLIREIGANAVRLAGYPQNDYFLSLCDKYGILVWSELPFAGPQNGQMAKGFVDSEEFRENGKTQLLEMLYQQYNHPSVCFIGIYNELILRGDNPTVYVTELNEIVKRNDRLRLTVASSVQDGGINSVTDLIGFNQSFGWGNGDLDDFDVWAKDVRRNFPQLKVGISAYGAGGSVFQQMESVVKPDKEGSFHPEQWQSQFHEIYWQSINSGHYFWGTFVSSMFDHGSSYRKDGYLKGINDNGLVSYDRQIRKDAFYFYKANWNTDDKFVHISDLRGGVVSVPDKTVKVYSNENSVSLYLNGELLGETVGKFGIFQWSSVQFESGNNVLRAVGDSGQEETVTIIYNPTLSKL